MPHTCGCGGVGARGALRYSDAGAQCAILAATRPERVAGLILYAAAASGKQQDDYEGQWSEEEWEAYFEFVRTSCGTDEYAHSTLREFAPSHVDDGRIGAWCRARRGAGRGQGRCLGAVGCRPP